MSEPPRSRNIKLTVAYDGTEFHGWQAQPGLRTVQGVLTETLQRVLRHPLGVSGASRTDAGVHARGQVANFRTAGPVPLDNIRRAAIHRLPEDMTIVAVTEVDPDFHASRSAGKLYRYRIHNAVRRPVEDLTWRYVWHVWYPLDVHRIASAARAWVGRHDFAAFATQGAPRESTVRNISLFEARRDRDEIVIDVAGDGFLYNQVRNMVGTLVEIGRGHWPVESASEILHSRSRSRAGRTAPPQGLCLERVWYENESPADRAVTA